MSDGPAGIPPSNLPPEAEAEIKRQVLARATDALRDFVDPEAAEAVAIAVLRAANQPVTFAVRQQAEFTAIQHSGVIPHPQLVEGYDQVLPGSAERLFKMAEKDQDAVIASNRRSQYMDFGFKTVALVAGVFGLGSLLYVIVRLAEGGHDAAAAAVAGMGAAGIITAFVNARHDKKAPSPPATAPAN